MKQKHVLLLTVAFLPAISSYSQKAIRTSIDSLLMAEHKMGLFNGNVLVMDNGKEVYKKAIGWTDANKTKALSTAYLFNIGSIAKEFNAVAIMMLKEQGKLQLEDKVSQYLSNLPQWASGISIQHLLQYSSGLPDVKWQTVRSDADHMKDLENVTKLNFEPGTRYEYNNSNVFIQRRIIEKVTGISFTQFVNERMLKPLGMNASVVDPAYDNPLLAIAYNNELKNDIYKPSISGWTMVTLDDFYKWSEALQSFRLISPASTEFLTMSFRANSQTGLGRGVMKDNKLVYHLHDGTSRNYQAILEVDFVKKRTIILMVNNRQDKLYDTKDAIGAILNGKPYIVPKKSSQALLEKAMEDVHGQNLVTLYYDLIKQYGTTYDLDQEVALNSLGYTFLRKNRMEDAIAILTLNTRLFPKSGNAFDSLGEAYYNAGDKKNALIYYKKSLELDPANTAAAKVIAELEK